jgi:hypothetical protein
LELLEEKGSAAWRTYIRQLEAQLKYIQFVAAEERQLLDEFNRNRRKEQSQSQAIIEQLENMYRDMTERIFALQKSCYLF